MPLSLQLQIILTQRAIQLLNLAPHDPQILRQLARDERYTKALATHSLTQSENNIDSPYAYNSS